MAATRSKVFFSTVVGCFLFFASSQAHAQQPTSQTAWTENDHSGSAPRSFQIQRDAQTMSNYDILSQRYTRDSLGDYWFVVTGVPVTMTVTGGGQTASFGAVTDGGGGGSWFITNLPLNVNSFTCTVSYNGGHIRDGVVLNPASATFTVTRSKY